MKSTIYDVWFTFNKNCQHCGCFNKTDDGSPIRYTMVHISAHGIPVCHHCGNKLFLHVECAVNNMEG